jgi:hypothetical protein
MSRHEHLHRAIQRVKSSRKYHWHGPSAPAAKYTGQNVDLAKFCGKPEGFQTSRWFWVPQPKEIPRATYTLLALKWVCKKVGISLIVPDWEVLRYYGIPRNMEKDDLIKKLQAKPKTFDQWYKDPWDPSSREPDGEIALRILGLCLSTQKGRDEFMQFLVGDLTEYPYRKLPAHGRADVKREHLALEAEAKKMRPIYDAASFTLPPWLEKILY